MSFTQKEMWARLAEGAIGATAGVGGGSILGAMTYDPKVPREWLDDYGDVQSRALSQDERSERIGRTLLGATGGSLLGAGLSLAASGALRGRVTRAERAAAEEVAKEYLEPLRAIVNRWTRLQERLPKQDGATAKGMLRRIRHAQAALHDERKKVKTTMVQEAARRRAVMPFGGPDTILKGSPTSFDYGSATHEGIAKKYFADLAARHGFREFNYETAPDVFELELAARRAALGNM